MTLHMHHRETADNTERAHLARQVARLDAQAMERRLYEIERGLLFDPDKAYRDQLWAEHAMIFDALKTARSEP
ncbi:MAG: hypothetical protein DI629_12320 [Mesorhizobium amorphae]|nr:MAG: hypothetical protein DI629_12320 [Mesorhizobium amorphae]